MQASIQFISSKGTYVFDSEGVPQWEQRTEYAAHEAREHTTPKIERTAYTIVQTFSEQSYADNEARIHRLRTMLDAGEGTLVIDDENGVNLVNVPVIVKSDTVPRAWRQYIAEITVVFAARTLTAAAASSLPATFTPPGYPPVTLPNVSDWKVAIRVNRFSNQASNRDESIETITAAGFILADRTQSQEDRLAFLQAQAELLRKCASRDGKLKWGTEERTVRVQSLDADLSDGKDRLNWTLAAFYRSFPSGSYAQPEYTVSLRNDYEAGSLITSVRGKVKADTETDAKNAVTDLKQSYAAPTRELQNDETSDVIAGGVDGTSWLELSFSFEYREPIPDFISYQLRVNTKEDARQADKIVNYEGRVSGTSGSAALTAARGLGLGKLPGIIASTETVATRKNSLITNEIFVEVTFSYEYMAKSTTLRMAEVTRAVVSAPFAEQRETVSGYVAAETLIAADAMVNALQLPGRLLRDSNRSYGERIIGADGTIRQAVKVDFSFSYYLTPISVGLSYGVETTNDFVSAEKTIVISGVARGPNEAACNGAIDLLISTRSENRISTSRKADFEKQNASSPDSSPYFVSVSFTERFIGVADTGSDILAASFSVRTSYSISKASLTLIPYGIPFVQTDVGSTPGVQTVTGSVTARSASGAKTWGAAKKALLAGGGYDDVIEDDIQVVFAPLDATAVTKYTYNFTFAARYQQLLASFGGDFGGGGGGGGGEGAGPSKIYRADITARSGAGNPADHIDLTMIPLLTVYSFVIDGAESDWRVEAGQVTDMADPEQIAMFNYDATANNKHLKKVLGY